VNPYLSAVGTVEGPALVVFVPGRPAPQGSKVAMPLYRGSGAAREFTGKVAMRESSAKGVDAWRNDVRAVVLAEWPEPPIEGGVALHITFVMPRPASLPKSRPTPAATKRPDVDKLVRSTCDALTSAGLWLDDSQVIRERIDKRIAEPGEMPGAWLFVHGCDAVPAPAAPTTTHEEDS